MSLMPLQDNDMDLYIATVTTEAGLLINQNANLHVI